MAGEYVYILTDHHEFGAEHAAATLAKNAVLPMVRKNWPARSARWLKEAETGLAHVLCLPDAELAGQAQECHNGYGGLHLHVVRVIE